MQAADLVGSTEFIRNQINNAPSGSVWAVGTEISLVNRLALNNPDKIVFCLDPVTCPCSTMYRIHPAYVLWVMEELLEGRVRNEITVPGGHPPRGAGGLGPDAGAALILAHSLSSSCTAQDFRLAIARRPEIY